MVHPGTLFHRRQRGIPMHSYENRGQIRALAPGFAGRVHPDAALPPGAGASHDTRPPRACGDGAARTPAVHTQQT
jgi:hypothetical protein